MSEIAVEKGPAFTPKMELIPVEKILASSDYNFARTNLPSIPKLAANIEAVGLIEPITVRPITEEEKKKAAPKLHPTEATYEYVLVAGFRRFAAIQTLKWRVVPASIRSDLDASSARIINVAENFERAELRLYDRMRSVYELREFGFKTEKIAKETGKSAITLNQWFGVWVKLSKPIKEKWSKIEDPAWEPSLVFLTEISHLSDAEQLEQWNQWANENPSEEESDLEEGEKKKPGRKHSGVKRKKTSLEIIEAIRRLEDNPTPENDIRAATLRWVMGMQKQ